MIVVDNTILSDDIKENFFVCNLQKCKGACCIEGDLGAPLADGELQILEEIFDEVKPYMTTQGIEAVETQGKYIKDFEGDFSTPIVAGGACAYAVREPGGILKCAIEQAYLQGKVNFKKPISCHLYPIRITQYDEFDAVNYHRWDICDPACSLGKELHVPLYIFLKEPLVRKYGLPWYEKLVLEIEGEKP